MEEKIEGYWSDGKNSKFPIPEPDILTENEAKKIYDLIIIKEKSAEILSYRGCSVSRITGKMLGNKEYQYDEWLWPADFAKHYVLENRVKPTDEFLEYIGYKK